MTQGHELMNQPFLSLRTHVVSVRTTQPLESQWVDSSCPIPPLRNEHRGVTCHPFLRAQDNMGQRIPVGAINMEVLDDWGHLEMCEEQASLSWNVRGRSTWLRGHFRRPELCEAAKPGSIVVVSAVPTVHKHILVWLHSGS